MLNTKAQASSFNSLFYSLRCKIMGCLLLLLICFPLKANDSNIQDHNLKAVYLFRFAFLTTWGEFAPASKQFNFCSAAELETSNTLQTLIEKKPERAKFTPYTSIKELEKETCHLIYLSTQSSSVIQQLKTTQPHALLIGDGKPFIQSGGMIAFIKVNNRIKPLISLNNIKPTGLSIRSQLLSVSEIATNEDKL
ncbi:MULTISPECIES: YfiR family protein [Aliivibrio]|uniref:YfiR family protein n=1 Tax=Aliivibrio finisterrensis TaxID=511998 RepID=A0A4V1Z9B4_9GAMM|nr:MULTISPECIES: YfiR family protein [Aliivibrio]MDD9178348.1 YfiR family protein [Aliivibrio sp. A6]RYU54915.1 YfiR family protein [Aliivibrio finisterrensis]RYU56591.1 YfiR family protein [Aliivibrio finisterrensis]RYU61712.1 YfiR family protein [Aliivibrio finisterrensis]RYU66541.1 YfiR family protein [Aliivibrio finisterrensis]